MTPRSLIVGTAVALALLGLPALFVPETVATVLGLGAGSSVPLQLFGGALLAFAALDWNGRGAIYGGIYGRPIVAANFGLGLITGSTMISATIDGRLPSWGWLLGVIFGLQAAGFFWLMRTSPVGRPESASPASE